MKNTLCKVVMVSSVMIFTSSALAGFGIPNLKKENKASSASSVDATGIQRNLVSQYVTAASAINIAQIAIADALGLKDQAEALKVEGEALQSGATKETLEASVEVSNKAAEEVEKKLASSDELSDESKKAVAKALVPYAQGLAETYKILPEFQNFLTAAQNQIQNAPITQKLKTKDDLAAGMYLATKLPGYAKGLYGSTTSLISFAKKNGLDEDAADATKALGGMDF